MHTTHSLKNWLRTGLFVLMVVILATVASGCRTKCIEGGDNYPACLDGGEQVSTGDIELTVWNLHDPKEALEGQFQAFRSLYPNVTINYKKFENEAEYERLIINEIAEGEGPDVFAIHHTWLPRHEKKLTPAPAELMIPQQFREKFFDVASESLIRSDDAGFESIYAVPLYIDTLALYYNKAVFRDGLSQSSTPGETWDDIKEQVFALTKTNNSVERFAISGMAMGRSDNIALAPDIFSLLLLQQGARLFEDDSAILSKQQGTQAGSGKAFFPAAEALKLYTSFALPSFKNYSWNQTITGLYPQQTEIGAFTRGKTAMIFGYSTTYDDIIATLEGNRRSGVDTIKAEEIGTTIAPQFLSAAESTNRDALANFYPLGVSRNSENPGAAWQLALFLADTDSAREYHRQTNKPTARFDLIEEQMTEQKYGAFARQVAYSKTLPVLDKADYDIIIRTLIDGVARSKVDVDIALQTADVQLQCVLDKISGVTVDANCTEAR